MNDFFETIYPRGNTHELTLDWILEQVQICVEGWKSTDTRFKTLEEAVKALTEYFYDFSKSDKFIEKINEALQKMYDDGSLGELLRSVCDCQAWETNIERFGRVPSPNAFFTGEIYDWISAAIPINRFKDAIKIGAGVFQNCEEGVSDCIAIGSGVMSEHQVGNHNIGIGSFCMAHLNGHGDGSGTRNIGIGSLAWVFARNLNKSIGIGRDVGQNVVEGQNNTIVGYCAMGGRAPIGLNGAIVNGAEISANKTTIFGAYNLLNTNDISNTVSIGAFCAKEAKNSYGNVLIGSNALLDNGLDTSINGKTLVTVNENATYCAHDNYIRVTKAGNQAVAGNYIRIKFTSGPLSVETTEQQTLYVSQTGEPEFMLITNYEGLEGEGECIITEYETNTPTDYEFQENVAIGNNVMEHTTRLVKSIAIGSSCVTNTPKVKLSTIIGRNVGYDNLKEVDSSTIIGMGAVSGSTISSKWEVIIGQSAGVGIRNSDRNTIIGYRAGETMVDGTTGVDVSDTVILGTSASCSGSHQVQLGGVNTTPYAYAELQVRSDARDKTDIRDTILGLDFINALRPVDFRWNVRECYKDRDNSSREHIGTRYHHGLIAQDIEKLIKETGVDFGGYQDHTINGGCDVKSLGYGELIAPMIKAIQELTARVHELEAQLNK